MLDAKKAIYQYVSGKFSLASNCQVEFDWDDPTPVGQTVTMKIRVSSQSPKNLRFERK
jgi:hypothetical protein